MLETVDITKKTDAELWKMAYEAQEFITQQVGQIQIAQQNIINIKDELNKRTKDRPVPPSNDGV